MENGEFLFNRKECQFGMTKKVLEMESGNGRTTV